MTIATLSAPKNFKRLFERMEPDVAQALSKYQQRAFTAFKQEGFVYCTEQMGLSTEWDSGRALLRSSTELFDPSSMVQFQLATEFLLWNRGISVLPATRVTIIIDGKPQTLRALPFLESNYGWSILGKLTNHEAKLASRITAHLGEMLDQWEPAVIARLASGALPR